MAADKIDLGDGHAFSFVEYEGERAGLTLTHPGCTAKGWIPFEGRSWARGFAGRIQSWKVENDEPLTLSPSIQCRACGDHGYIRNGKWERA